MICNQNSDTMSLVAAAFVAVLVAVTVPTAPTLSVLPANAAALAASPEPMGALRDAVPAATPISARDVAPTGSVGLGGGGCGERPIRVFDPSAGEYRMRTASVCWRSIL